MKKKLITLALCAALALAMCVPAAAFTDVAPEKWYAPAVDYCEQNGLMNGFPDGSFDPEGTVTRAQLVTTLWRLAGEPETEPGESFDDVPDGAWYADAVRWAKATGITDGTGDGHFSPALDVTREMLVTFFYRFAGRPASAGEDFADQAEIASWAALAARWANGAGVMAGVGDGCFDPKSTATRAALAQTLMNYAEGVGGEIAVAELGEQCAPVGVARGKDGALYITDALQKAIWRLGNDGWTRIAGAESVADANDIPMGGMLDGPAEYALFLSPWAIAPFLDGWAISDPENNVVRLLLDGTVSTLGGLSLDYPTGLAADGNGGLYVASTHAGEIWLLYPDETATLVAVGLDNPMGLCYAGGALYVAETGARRVIKIVDGEATLVAGSGAEGEADGEAAEAAFFAPEGVAVGPDGSVYVADTVGAAVRCVRNGEVTTLIEPADGLSLDTFPRSPVGLLLDGARLYVCDRFARKLFSVATE